MCADIVGDGFSAGFWGGCSAGSFAVFSILYSLGVGAGAPLETQVKSHKRDYLAEFNPNDPAGWATKPTFIIEIQENAGPSRPWQPPGGGWPYSTPRRPRPARGSNSSTPAPILLSYPLSPWKPTRCLNWFLTSSWARSLWSAPPSRRRHASR